VVDWGHLGVMVQGLDVGGEVGLVKASVGVSVRVGIGLGLLSVRDKVSRGRLGFEVV
jgi:hypothetical protein